MHSRMTLPTRTVVELMWVGPHIDGATQRLTPRQP